MDRGPFAGKISHKKMVAFVSAFSVCAVVAVALCISAIHWRKKLFAGHYEHKFAHDRIGVFTYTFCSSTLNKQIKLIELNQELKSEDKQLVSEALLMQI